ncbi:MAG: type VI secretion system tip protein VgrG [Planctomycetes bacterium]|nr:type VI secretion system tip protein VgrG [Planctomycetota bacterium]
MKFQNQVLSLHSDALPADTLMVQKLTGEEQMSGLFRFELELICEDRELDLEQVLYAPCKLAIRVSVPIAGGQVGSATREIAGVFESFEQHEQGQGWAKYRAVMVPKLWFATRAYRSRIFMDVTIEDLVRQVLEADGLSHGLDFEFQLQRPDADGDPKTRPVYPEREYVVQYEETDWDFLARWLEHEGIYFYFTNDGGDEKVVFADTESSYAKSMFGSEYPYRPEATGDGGESDTFTEEEVRSFVCRQTRLPAEVSVNDYNWRVPSARLHYTEDVREDGTGLQTQYNDHFKDEAQGKALVLLRKEELICRARVFHGTGSCRAFRPGTTFSLSGHYRDDFDRSYLLVTVQHAAEQMISLESATVTGFKYDNTFTAIADDQAWRPERTTNWPTIHGVMHAKVDAEGDGQYAELDEFGRYKLTMPFDEHADEAEPGKASRWVRMAQPYAGENAGMHFPLLKGTEVLIVHIDGDPDRPIICGAVPNPETESPTTGNTYTRNTIRTASGNVMKFDDSRSASGFVFADSLGSMICDYRWRTGGTPPPASTNGSTSGGNGGARAKTPQPGQPQRAAATPAASLGGTPAGGNGSAVPGDPEGEIISTIWDEGVDETDGAAVGWRAYFRDGGASPTAFQQIGSNGRYTDETASPLGLSSAADITRVPLLADTTMTEANIVKMFNKLLEHHPRASESDSVDGTALSGVIGKLVKVARNFEATAAGSTVGVDVGDQIKVTVGDVFEYTDGSNEIKIGTGGYSREETRGDATKESFTWGNSTETTETSGDVTKTETTYGSETSTSTNYANKSETSYDYSDHVKFELTIGAYSETEIQIGAFNKNSVTVSATNENDVKVGVFATSEIFVGGKVELIISAAGNIKTEIMPIDFQLNMKYMTKLNASEDKLSLQAKKVQLDEINANLNKSDAQILENKVGINETKSKLNEVKNALNQNTNALNTGVKALAQQTMVLAGDDKRVMNNVTTAMNSMTSGVTMIQ